MGIVYGIGLLLAFLIGVPTLIYMLRVVLPATGGAGTPSGTKTWVMMGATAVALLISWLTVGLLLAFALLCFAGFVWMKWKKVDGAGFVAFIGAGFLFAWIVGPAAVEYRREQVTAVVAGQPAPTPPVTPLTAEEQAARLERERQEAEVQRVRAAADAAARAQAEEAARLVTSVSSQLPTSVRVPHCDQGWSDEILIPAGWFVRADWGGQAMKTQILQDGNWVLQTTLNVRGQIAAVRYCTTSNANLELRNGIMPLNWSPM